jgi:undecaprenyl pyrophosphate synthase
MTSSLAWVQDKIWSKAEDVILHVLAAGPIPQHVAFVMDGNRRYARMNHKQTLQGHSDGFLALRRVRGGCSSRLLRVLVGMTVPRYVIGLANMSSSQNTQRHRIRIRH